MIMLTSVAASAQPMSYYAMRNNARFLTDRMAYTLGLSAALLDDLYLINYDYICGVNDYLDDVALGYRYDDYMEVVYARDYALRRLLTERQWALLMTYDYFYRPISFLNHRWSFGIYAYDVHYNVFHFREPRRFNDYRGGHFFGGMRPMERMGHPGGPGAPGHGMPRGDMRGGQMQPQAGARQGYAQPGNVQQVAPVANSRSTYHVGEVQPNGQGQQNTIVNVNNNARTSAQTVTYGGGTRTTAGSRSVNVGNDTRVTSNTYQGSVDRTMPSTPSRSSASAATRSMSTTTSRSTATTSVNRNMSSTRSSSAMGSSTRSMSSGSSATRSGGVSAGRR